MAFWICNERAVSMKQRVQRVFRSLWLSAIDWNWQPGMQTVDRWEFFRRQGNFGQLQIHTAFCYCLQFDIWDNTVEQQTIGQGCDNTLWIVIEPESHCIALDFKMWNIVLKYHLVKLRKKDLLISQELYSWFTPAYCKSTGNLKRHYGHDSTMVKHHYHSVYHYLTP